MDIREMTPKEVRAMFEAQDRARASATEHGQGHVLADRQIATDPHRTMMDRPDRGIFEERISGKKYYQTGFICTDADGQRYGLRYDVVAAIYNAHMFSDEVLADGPFSHLGYIIMPDTSGNKVLWLYNPQPKSYYFG
jgi:hypothetical protein